MTLFKKTLASGLALLVFAACGGPPPRPTINNDLDGLRWGDRSKKNQIITSAFNRKDPSDLIKLLEVTAKEVVQTRVKQDIYWYDNREEQLWTLRFVVNVLAQRLKPRAAFPAVLELAACPWYKDTDGFASWLEPALVSLGTAADVEAMVAKAAQAGIAPSHKGAILHAAALLLQKADKPTPQGLSTALKNLLESSDSATLLQGIRLAGTLKYKPAEALIAKQLTSPDAGTRRAAATALVLLGNPQGIVPLLEMDRADATALNKTSDMIEKAGFADQVRMWHAEQQGKEFRKQTEYLEKMGAFK